MILLTQAFDVKTGTKQWHMLSPFLFLLVTDWMIRQCTINKRTAIHWVSRRSLEDLALPSHSVNDTQNKTEWMEEVAASVWLRINKCKTKIMKVNAGSYLSKWLYWRSRRVHLPGKCSILYHRRQPPGCTSQIGKGQVNFQSHGSTMEIKDHRKSNKSKDIQLQCEVVIIYASKSSPVS